MRDERCRGWIGWVLALGAGVITLVGLFNLVIDPYDIYQMVRVPGFNATKGMAMRQERIIKPLRVRLSRPHSLILGSSRAAIGIDPQHPGWNPAAAPVYNLALTGATAEELAGRLKEAVTVTAPRQVVVGLDFFMFNVYLDNPMSPTVGKDSPPWPLKTLFTGAALADSWKTLRKQDSSARPSLLANGQISPAYNISAVAKHGHRQGFLDFERIFFEASLFPLPEKEYALEDSARARRSIDAFRQLLEVARESDIDLRLFISPVHVRLLEVYAEANLWNVYEEWKRQLVIALEEHNVSYPTRRSFPLWDFSGVNCITTETVPPAGDTTAMSWFWESSHFKSETGDLILDRIFGYQRPGHAVPDDFGLLLTSLNIESHLVDTRSALEIWRSQHPQDIAEVRAAGHESAWRNGKYRCKHNHS